MMLFALGGLIDAYTEYMMNVILKQTIHFISEPIAFIFNKCMCEGYFGTSLKVSKIIPICKKGHKSMPQNY